jgi:predicted Rossmann fold nucleotide-binding protein DprA/Smf involved in DNA uptake
VFSYIDIVNEYLTDVCERLSESAIPNDLEKPTSRTKNKGKAKTESEAKEKIIEFKKSEPLPQAAPKADYSDLPETPAKIVAALQKVSKKGLSFDEILKKKLLTSDNAHEILLDMELDGLIEKIAGDRYTLCQ